MSSAATTSAGGGRGGDAHESERSLISFAGSKLSRHLRHANADRVEAMEGLLALLCNRVYGRVSRSDMSRVFNALGGDAEGGGGELRVA